MSTSSTYKKNLKLTARGKKVIRLIYEGMLHAEAYMQVYGVAKNTAKVKASELYNSNAGKAYIKKLDEGLDAEAIMSRVEALQKLADIADNPKSSNTDVIKAIKQFCKTAGYDEAQKLQVDVKTIKIDRV